MNNKNNKSTTSVYGNNNNDRNHKNIKGWKQRNAIWHAYEKLKKLKC